MGGKGKLIIIGGAEDKENECEILKEVTDSAGQGKIVIITTATQKPAEAGRLYSEIFRKLGIENVEVININSRQDAQADIFLQRVEGAACVFFTGGDQLRITSILGGTLMGTKLKEMFDRGVAIVGTSAGASAMSSVMIVAGNDEDSPRKCTVKMAPGLGLLSNCVIDQHFAQRGRIGRLICAVAQNPHVLGIGIDEDTAIVVQDERFDVIGSQAVTIVDGSTLSFSNVSETKPDELLALMDIKMHVLSKGYGFDLIKRKPIGYREVDNENS
ncbi:MAG: cyanophycinase [Bacillota bacterium]|nr:cyanophycinase [Bacillota bacterium]